MIVDELRTDVNGETLARGDWVEFSDAMKMAFPELAQGLGVGQVEHIFEDGPRKGIHLRFKSGTRMANNGHALRKVPLSALRDYF
jgi:hypothetical protein